MITGAMVLSGDVRSTDRQTDRQNTQDALMLAADRPTHTHTPSPSLPRGANDAVHSCVPRTSPVMSVQALQTWHDRRSARRAANHSH